MGRSLSSHVGKRRTLMNSVTNGCCRNCSLQHGVAGTCSEEWIHVSKIHITLCVFVTQVKLLTRCAVLADAVLQTVDMILHEAIEAAKRHRNEIKKQLKKLEEDLRVQTSMMVSPSGNNDNVAGKCKIRLCRKDHDIAVLLQHIPNDGPDWCAAFLKHVQQHQNIQPEDIRQKMVMLRDIPREQSVDLVHTEPWWSRRDKDAKKFMAECKLQAWIQKENDQGGLAPTTRRACGAHVGTTSDYTLPNGMPPVSAGGPLPKRMKQWTRRWARRFKLRRGTLPSTSTASATEFASKVPPVRLLCSRKIHGHVPKLFPESPKNGPSTRTRFRPPKMNHMIQCPKNLGPLFGRRKRPAKNGFRGKLKQIVLCMRDQCGGGQISGTTTSADKCEVAAERQSPMVPQR